MATDPHTKPSDTPHGIRNAQARYAEHAEYRQMRSRLIRGSKRRKERGGREMSSYTNETATPRQRQAMQDSIRSIFTNAGEEFTEGDEELIIKNPPKNPRFPYIIVALAILKDLLDVGDLSIVGIVLTTAVSFLIAIVLFFWTLGKLSGGWWKKKMISWLWKRYILAIAIEFTPFGKIIPATTIFILMAHYREKRIVKVLNEALEELHRKGF